MVKPEGVRKLFPKGHPKTPKFRNISCAFCGGEDHLSDVCLHIRSVPKRRSILIEQHKCKRCLDDEDESHNCADPFCKYCGGGTRHSAVCVKTTNVMKRPKPVRQIKRRPEVTSTRCALCGANHDPDQCPQVKQQRLVFLQNKTPRRCVKCLKIVERGGPSTSEPKCNEQCETECQYCSSWEHHISLCPHPVLSLEASLERPAEENRPSVKRQRGDDDSNRPISKRPSSGHRETGAASHRQATTSSHRNSEDRSRRQAERAFD